MEKVRYKIMGMMVLAGMLTGCHLYEKRQQDGAAVELNGHYLYQATLDSLTLGLTGEDSVRVVTAYVRQWAEDLLEYDAAKKAASKELEEMVDDYRRSLYVHQYEQRLIERKMRCEVADSVVERIYEAHPEQYKLKESLVQGVLLIVPKEAPNLQRLRQWLAQPGDKHLEDIEKYAYKYATGYDLFTDRWVTASQLLLQMPFETDELDGMLQSQKHIELTDSASLYILQVTAKVLRGEQMPLAYARPEIEDKVCQLRQADFIREEREKQYKDAIRYKKIRFYEKK